MMDSLLLLIHRVERASWHHWGERGPAQRSPRGKKAILIWWYSRSGTSFNPPPHLKGHVSGLHKQVYLLASGQ